MSEQDQLGSEPAEARDAGMQGDALDAVAGGFAGPPFDVGCTRLPTIPTLPGFPLPAKPFVDVFRHPTL